MRGSLAGNKGKNSRPLLFVRRAINLNPGGAEPWHAVAVNVPFPGEKLIDRQVIIELTEAGVSNMPAPYTGGCQCGSGRYVLTVEPMRVVACPCKECQRQSRSAF